MLDIYVEQAPVLMPAAAAVFLIAGVLSAVLLTGGPALALLALIVSLLATTLFTGMVVELVADVQDGRRDSRPGQLLRAVMPVLGQLLLVGIVVAIGVVVGFVLIVIPGLILITIWFVAPPVVVLERPPGLGALARSRELVRGNGWQVFGVILLLAILVSVLTNALGLAAESASLGAGIVVRVVLGVLTAPLPALASAVLYFRLRALAVAPAAGAGDVSP